VLGQGERSKVVLQLPYSHQFQFAGYYAAQAKGYFAAEGLEVVGISEDSFADAVPPFVAEHKMTYTVLLDLEQAAGEAYSLRGLPQAFLIDREGRLVQKWFGWEPGHEPAMRAAVEQALKPS